MNALAEHVRDSVVSRRLLRRGDSVLIAVSGGVDSMVLLDVLRALAAEFRWKLTIAHVNHLLRGRASNADENLVRRIAKSLRLPLVVKTVDVKQWGRANEISIEMAGRKLRHDLLARIARQRRIAVIALAHHADDQVENFFLRLFRGSGIGLRGMKWKSPSPANARIQLIRPLLDLPKDALVDYARKEQVEYREDATNRFLGLKRNRIRHKLLPLIRRDYQRGIDGIILRTMDIIGSESEYVAEVAKRWLRNAFPGQKHLRPFLRKSVNASNSAKGSTSAVEPFQTLPPALQRYCLQIQLISLGLDPEFEQIERLRHSPGLPVPIAARAESGLRVGLCIERSQNGLLRLHYIGTVKFEPGAIAVHLRGRTRTAQWGPITIRWVFEPVPGDKRPASRSDCEYFDAQKVGGRVVLRHWQPGDRFQPIGMQNEQKLQDIFTNEKVPRTERHRRVVAVTQNGEIFWVEGLRISERFKLTNASKRRLKWCWRRRKSRVAVNG